MLSILIPTYNHNVFPLVKELQNQCMKEEIAFEIIILDDASTFFRKENSAISSLMNCTYTLIVDNLGRTAVRNILAKNASFENLLFLDADVIPKSKKFIKNYINICKKETYNSVFGGYHYTSNLYSPDTSLRYYYGKNREEKAASHRSKYPFSFIFSGNFMIKKSIFLSLKIPNTNVYGMDIFFSYLLYKNNINVIHIDNEIIHNGLEKNVIFFEKSLTSITYRKTNWLHIEEIKKINKLLNIYDKLNIFPINNVLKVLFYIFNKTLKKWSIQDKPNLMAFDIYRLLYLFK